MAGTGDKIKGTIKESVGKATGDKRLQSEGKTDKAKGHIKEGVQNVKDAARGVGDSLKR